MRVGAILAGAAGLLCATYGPGTGGFSREAYLRRLESCPEDELRRRLDFRLWNDDLLGAREMVKTKEVYLRIKLGRLDGYFAMVGMMLTDGMWHRRYVEVFERSELDVARNEETIRELMDEMVTGEIWTEAKRRLAEMAARRLEEECNNGGKTRAPEESLSNVVYHIAWEIERRLPSGDRRWGRVLKALLKKDGVTTGLVEGRYNKEVRRMICGNEELKHVLYGHVLRWRSVLNSMVDNNEALAREMVIDGVAQGCWLYMDALEGAMGTERMRRLFPGGGAFEKIRVEHRLEGELSIGRLWELGREGRLDGLIRGVIRRLVGHGETFDLRRLTETVEGRRLFDGLLSSGELDAALKEGVGKLIGYGRIYYLKTLIETVDQRLFDRLLGSRELDAVLGEGVEELIRNGWISALKRLIETVDRRVLDGLLGSGELDAALREGIGMLVGDGDVHELKRLLGTVDREFFDRLVSGGELDGKLREGIGKLIGCGRIGDLRVLIEVVGGRMFDGLLSRRELGPLLKEGMERLARDGNMYDLKLLIETLSGGFDELVSRGELDAALREEIERLIRRKLIKVLRMLIGIEIAKRRVPGRHECMG